MITPLEYDVKVTSLRSCIALVCLAALCLAALTPAASLLFCAIVLPLCYVFSQAVAVSRAVDTEQEPLLFGFCPALPARAPPAVS